LAGLRNRIFSKKSDFWGAVHSINSDKTFFPWGFGGGMAVMGFVILGYIGTQGFS
jgi:hypothetical protein